MRKSLVAGRYLLIEQVGRGGFAVVWRARDDRLQRDVAAKQLFLPPHHTEAQRRERALREARSAARLTHPGVVTVYDVVEHDGVPWIIMEFVPGRTLRQIVRTEGPLPPARAARVGRRLLDALRAAHAAGVLHRDVKPSNVIIGDERVVLGDFGIARTEGDDELTETGIVMGAPSYTAPERARGEPAVAASDLWSLGATLFYAVEGRRAFNGPNANAIFYAVLTGEPAPARRAGPLGPVIEGLMRRDAADRLSAQEAAVLLASAARVHDRASVHRARRRQDTWREPTRPTSGVPAAPPPRPVAAARAAPAPPAPPGSRRPGGPRRRRPILTVASLTSLAVLLLGNGLRVDEPRRRLGASYRGPVSRPRLTATLTAPLPAGRAEVFSLASSPGSPGRRTLATGGDAGNVRRCDLHGHRRPATVPRLRERVKAVASSPDGRTPACGSGEAVLVWNVRTGAPSARLDARTRTVAAIVFSPGGRAATAGDDLVRLWNLG